MNIPTQDLNYFSVADVYNVLIETPQEMVARRTKEAHLMHATCDSDVSGLPDITITYQIGGNSDSGEVYVELWDTGNEEDDGRKIYDMGFSTNNNDNWGMIMTQSAINAAVQKHFELDLHQRFLMTGEDC